MNKIKKVLATAMIGTLAFSAVGCKMIEKTPEAIKKTVVAKVGEVEITKGDLDKLIPSDEQLAQQYGADFKNNEKFKEDLKAFKKDSLGKMIDQEIMIQKAKELNLVPAKEELDKQVTETLAPQIEQVGGDEAYKSALEQMGVTEEEYKKDIEKMIITQLVMEHMTKDVKISDEDVKKYYDENVNEFTEADMSHILVEDEAKAKEIRTKLDNDGDFAALAKEFSKDGSGQEGGSLGVTKYNTLVPEFVTGLNSIKEGEISQPVKSKFGYHIIKYTDKKVEAFDDVKEATKSKLQNEAEAKVYNESLDKWNEELKVKIYEDRL